MRRASYNSSGQVSPRHAAEEWEDPEAAEADKQRAAIAAAAAQEIAWVRVERKAAALAAAGAVAAAPAGTCDSPPRDTDASLDTWQKSKSLSAQEAVSRSTEASDEASSVGQAAEDSRVSPEDMEAVLLWQDPWLSLRCFGCGLYVLIFLRELAIGALPLRGMTLAATGCLLLLGGNLATRTLRGCDLLPAPLESPVDLEDVEVGARLRAEATVLQYLGRTLPFISAAAALLVRRLSGRDKMAALWMGLLLWGVAVASESQITSQPTVAIATWVAVFSLPPAYSAGRRVMDALAEEMLDAAAALLGRGSQVTAGLMAASIAVGWAFGGPSYYGKITIAAVSGCAAMLLHTLAPSRDDP